MRAFRLLPALVQPVKRGSAGVDRLRFDQSAVLRLVVGDGFHHLAGGFYSGVPRVGSLVSVGAVCQAPEGSMRDTVHYAPGERPLCGSESQTAITTEEPALVLRPPWNQKGKGGEVWSGRPGC